MSKDHHQKSGLYVAESSTDGTGCNERVILATCICCHCGERFAIDYHANEQTCPLCETAAPTLAGKGCQE